jgi:hypothetical protein
MARYKEYSYSQGKFIPIHFSKQILPGTFEYTLNYLIDNSKAIRRLISDKLHGDADALATIDEAYNIRSRILHDGATDADLEMKGREVEAVVRRVFEQAVADFATS